MEENKVGTASCTKEVATSARVSYESLLVKRCVRRKPTLKQFISRFDLDKALSNVFGGFDWMQ